MTFTTSLQLVGLLLKQCERDKRFCEAVGLEAFRIGCFILLNQVAFVVVVVVVSVAVVV
jgi:hypothetical protein